MTTPSRSTTGTEPRLSVVTPFYNTELYLAECIESVLSQGYQNLEFILVDNQSTDGSLAIAQRYAAQDARIRILRTPEFLTQTQNLNYTVAQVSADAVYVKILQADDFLFPGCLSQMVAVAEQHPTVAVVGAYTILAWRDRAPVYLDGLPYPSPFTSGREIIRQYLQLGRYVTGSPTSTLLRAAAVRKRIPFYTLKSPVEDVDAILEILEENDFGFVHQVLTYTRRENESILSALRVFNLGMLAEVVSLLRHGPQVLSPEEFKACSRRTEGAYYLMLGEAVLRRQPKKFWEMHREGLRWAGSDINRGRVARYVVLAVVLRLLNPLPTLAAIWRRIRG